MRKDRDIWLDIVDLLAEMPGLNAEELTVVVENGVVTLTGLVPTAHLKFDVEGIAKHVRGVRAVANDIEVGTRAIHRSDVEIATDVVDALEGEGLRDNDQVLVTVRHGWVTLEGNVESDRARTTAERVTRTVVGVRGVANAIRVTPPAPEQSPVGVSISC